MPSVVFGIVQPQITVFVNGVKDGNDGIAYGSLTNISATGTAYSHIGLIDWKKQLYYINQQVAVFYKAMLKNQVEPPPNRLSSNLYDCKLYQ